MDIRGKKVLVFGSGISGEGSCRLLLEKGAEVVLYDGNEKLCADEIEAKILETEKRKRAIQYSARNISGRDYRRAFICSDESGSADGSSDR